MPSSSGFPSFSLVSPLYRCFLLFLPLNAGVPRSGPGLLSPLSVPFSQGLISIPMTDNSQIYISNPNPSSKLRLIYPAAYLTSPLHAAQSSPTERVQNGTIDRSFPLLPAMGLQVPKPEGWCQSWFSHPFVSTSDSSVNPVISAS